MRKLILTLIMTLLFGSTSCAQTYFYNWRQRINATDCTAITNGNARDLCYEQDSDSLFVCEPTEGDSGTCDTADEWRSTSSSLTDEQIQDAAFTSTLLGTETLIDVSYNDVSNVLDFVVNNDLSQYDNTTSNFISGGSDLELNGYMIESNTAGIRFDSNDDGTEEITFDTAGKIVFPTAYIYNNNTGQVRIGTSNGEADYLTIDADDSSFSNVRISANRTIRFDTSTLFGGGVSVTFTDSGEDYSSSIQHVNNGTLTVTSSNGLTLNSFTGINDATPDAELEISNDGGSTIPFMVSSDDANDGDYFTIGSDGNVGINDSSPDKKLDVAGTAIATQLIVGGATQVNGATSWDVSDTQVAHYKFDGDFTDSEGTYDATAQSGAATTATNKKLGTESLILNGSSDYATTGVLTLSATGTITAWVRPDNVADASGDWAVGIIAGGSPYGRAYFGVKTSKITGGLAEDGLVGTTTLINGTWYFVALRWTDTTSSEILVNLVSEDSDTPSESINTSLNPWIGVLNSNGSPSGYFDGMIDDVRFHNVSLTNDELTALYNAGAGTHDNTNGDLQIHGVGTTTVACSNLETSDLGSLCIESDLDVGNNIYISGDVRIGSGTVDFASTGDVYIANDLEVDGTIYGNGAGITGLSTTITKTLEDPADADSFLIFKAPAAFTITDIDCIVDPADSEESVVIDIQECDSAGDNCATVDATITCDNDGAADDGSFSNGAIDSGDWIKWDIGTVTGTVTQVTVTIVGEY